MFGAVPGVFRNAYAAIKAGAAYSLEENIEWVVVVKDCDGTDWYNVCRAHDIEQAAKEGYVKYGKE